MTLINKQKFLAELGRLLTFMYEEDRKLALDMYGKIFDACPQPHALMQLLVSPTRQAVNIARAYDAADRKLQIQSVSRDGDAAECDSAVPEFVMAIDHIYQLAADKGLLEEESRPAPVLENQISLFEEEDTEETEEVPAPAEVEEEAETVEECEVPEETPEAEDESSPEDEVDAFLASFSIAEEELVPEQVEEDVSVSEEILMEEPAVETENEPAEEVAEEVSQQIELDSSEIQAQPVVSADTVRKPRVFLLFLYTIFAIPVTLAGLSLLLIPTALILALACTVILAGSASFVAAFSGFAVFADLLVVLGTALVILALGLILLWLFIWFIGGAMVSLVKAIVHLGKKCCYKEVPAV